MILAMVVLDIMPEFRLDNIPLDTIPFSHFRHPHMYISIFNLNEFFCKISVEITAFRY